MCRKVSQLTQHEYWINNQHTNFTSASILSKSLHCTKYLCSKPEKVFTLRFVVLPLAFSIVCSVYMLLVSIIKHSWWIEMLTVIWKMMLAEEILQRWLLINHTAIGIVFKPLPKVSFRFSIRLPNENDRTKTCTFRIFHLLYTCPKGIYCEQRFSISFCQCTSMDSICHASWFSLADAFMYWVKWVQCNLLFCMLLVMDVTHWRFTHIQCFDFSLCVFRWNSVSKHLIG